MSVTADPPLLRVERVSKRFGNVVALENVSLAVHAARVTCVLGDNGAGKSTLIRILSGVHAPGSGRCFVDGQEIDLESPKHALERGIATVHQDLALIPLMSIWRNFFLGAEIVRGAGPFRRIDAGRCRSLVRDRLADLGIVIRDPDQTVGTLSGGERQCVAIARAMHFGARVLILDEPTAALGVRQAGIVLRFIASARDRGVGVVFITHNPHHAHAVGDHFIVLRHGRIEGEWPRETVGLDRLITEMAGGKEAELLSRELAPRKAE
jgi:simple sugar transport system ATP-binding protein